MKIILISLLVIAISFIVSAQQIDQNKKEPIDINSKSSELGITAEQLQSILSSTANENGGGDPLPDAMQERFFTGQNAHDWFGYSVSSAGDVNGDGYEDIIVGIPTNDITLNDLGKAYIFYGGNIIDYSADVMLTGNSLEDKFGNSVSAAGDVNGDGYDDVIVAAYFNDNGGADAGIAYIYFGGISMDNTPDVIMTGASAGDWFGISVSTAGDVNGDGFSDVIVGAWQNDAGGTDAGRAYIYFGGASMNNTADVILTGINPGDNFGNSVSDAGDVNGDGFSDVIVGAWTNDAGGTDAGRAYIYFGASSMDNTADIVLTGVASGDNFGNSVSAAGDVNGDGYHDVIVSAWGNDVGGSDAGAAYIFLGGAGMDNTADVLLKGTAVDDRFGFAVSAAGDVNGDAYDDVIVGAPYNESAGNDAGRAYIYFGGPVMDNIADAIMTGEAAGDNFGLAVAFANDMNGDGYSEPLVGAYRNDTNGLSSGRVYLYTNSLTGIDIPDEFFTGSALGEQLGFSVSNAGDVNGDGYDDIIAGATGYSGNRGRAYIYFGGEGMDNIADVILTGEASDDRFGRSVSTAGDVNEDGYADVIVGAWVNDAGGSDAGRAYIYFGGVSMDNTADVTLTGATANELFGESVSTAGDVNGDGYADVIAGASGYQSSLGRAYIYYGGAMMNNIPDVIMIGGAAVSYFGHSVSTAGDVNGDGYADIIVGARGYSSNTGRAYIYYGGVSMNNAPDIILTGETVNNYFGSVSAAGDVNGDGYADVIVGATGHSSNTGRAYIYFGEASMDNTADIILTGESSDNFFGRSVSTTGDVNGDGYADVIVGAEGNNAAGRAYIYFGGANTNNVVDVILTGAAGGDNFGISVSTAGDVNGDGYADVIVGALYNNAGGTEAGRAYLYISSPPPVKPRIMNVKDVPFDQGGQVRLKWVRSSYDVQGINKISDYLIQRSFPPDQNGFAWENIATMPASNEPFYSYVAETPNDSMTNNSGTYYFRITARTNLPAEYWRSNIMSGHSVDNLAPFAPFNFYANLLGDDVKLGWKANTEPDFRDYLIYRSDTPVIDDFELLGTTTDTTFIDTSPIVGNAYYYVQAYDVHDNGSPYSSDSIMAYLSANIRVFLEGAYIGGQMSTFINTLGYIPLTQPYNTAPWNYSGTESVASIPANVTDWILVELRSTTTTLVDRRAAFLKNDGTLVDVDGVSNIKFPTAAAGDYYVVIIHRNHLSVMTANPIAISFNPTLYDMRTDLSKAFGTNAMKNLGGGYYGIYSADTDGSGTVNATDRSNTWNQRNLSGYYGTDVDLSSTVNAADRSAVWNNRNISTQVPASTDNPITKIFTGGSNE